MTEYYYLLLDYWKKEKNNKDIQPLPEGFFDQISGYSKRLKEEKRKSDSSLLVDKIIDKEKLHVDSMINHLWELRLEKIVKAELDGNSVEPLNLTNDEKKFQVDLRRLIASHNQSLKHLLIGREIIKDTFSPPVYQPVTPSVKVEKQEINYKVVRFLQALPAIMGIDLKTYGPFKIEDVATLPAQNAENLIRKGIAKVVEIDQ
ncbi:hypothetical protein JW865_07950 [Candidatus Bathyarchaeota archaeon]|nr:hypothetical protein [Candidatus Bathyarchaeota archaeon]